MNNRKLDPTHLLGVLAQRALTCRPPKPTAPELEAILSEWLEDCGHMSNRHFSEAMARFRRTSPYFPSTWDILQAYEQRPPEADLDLMALPPTPDKTPEEYAAIAAKWADKIRQIPGFEKMNFAAEATAKQ